MYRRYSQVNENAVPVSQVRRNRMKNILILLLLAALVAVTVVSVPALRSRNAMRELYIRRMQVEISDAAKQTTSLSRSAGADSSAILARDLAAASNLLTVVVIMVLPESFSKATKPRPVVA